MKLSPSNRTLAILFIAILVFSAVNTFLIIYQTSTQETRFNENLAALNQTFTDNYKALNQSYTDLNVLFTGEINNLDARLPIQQYDYVVDRDWDYQNNVSVYLAKNGKTGLTDFNGTDAAAVINQALTMGNSVYLRNNEYNLTSDVEMLNKQNARLDSDAAVLNMGGHRILVRGDSYVDSQNNQVSGLHIINGTVRIENSYQTTVTNMIFDDCGVAVELTNTNTWTEATKLDTIHFNKCTQSIVFRTNTTSALADGNSTGSYGNTLLSRCYFNLLDNSIAITVEPQAELTDSQLTNLRIWAGEFSYFNQTGLLLQGSMRQTLLDGVVFESFANSAQAQNASMYAVHLDTPYDAPNFQAGISILGGWTGTIFNPNNTWIGGAGGVFKQLNKSIPVGKQAYGEPVEIQTYPLTITSFKPKITVAGNFLQNETVTVRFTLYFIDNVKSPSVEKTFNTTSSTWLSDDDLIVMFPSQDIIWSILVDAQVNSASSNAKVSVDIYGTTT